MLEPIMVMLFSDVAFEAKLISIAGNCRMGTMALSSSRWYIANARNCSAHDFHSQRKEGDFFFCLLKARTNYLLRGKTQKLATYKEAKRNGAPYQSMLTWCTISIKTTSYIPGTRFSPSPAAQADIETAHLWPLLQLLELKASSTGLCRQRARKGRPKGKPVSCADR